MNNKDQAFTGPSRLFREYIKRFPNDSFTRLLIKDLELKRPMGHTATGIYTANFDMAYFHADNEILPKLEELTGVTIVELRYLYDNKAKSVYDAYVNYLHEAWK